MGGIILTGSIPKLPFLTAGATICTPVDCKKTEIEMRRNCFNMYQHNLGNIIWNLLLENKDQLQDELKEKAGYDLVEKVAELKRERAATVSSVDDLVIAPCFGYRDRFHYYETIGPVDRLYQVKIPLLWLMAEDDPFNGTDFGRDVFKQNPNIALATTKRGGHVAARESLWAQHIWFIDPVVKLSLINI